MPRKSSNEVRRGTHRAAAIEAIIEGHDRGLTHEEICQKIFEVVSKAGGSITHSSKYRWYDNLVRDFMRPNGADLAPAASLERDRRAGRKSDKRDKAVDIIAGAVKAGEDDAETIIHTIAREIYAHHHAPLNIARTCYRLSLQERPEETKGAPQLGRHSKQLTAALHMGDKKAKVFISYRRRDWGAARALFQELQVVASPFMDVGHIRPGEDFAEVINKQVAAADVVLAVIGPSWLSLLEERSTAVSDWVAIELETALRLTKTVIPVLIDDGLMPDQGALPESLKLLARKQALHIRHASFKSDCESLIAALRDG